MTQAKSPQFLVTTSFSVFSIFPRNIKHVFTLPTTHTWQTDRDWFALIQHAERCHAVVHTTENYRSTAQHILKPVSSVTTKPSSDTTQDIVPHVSAACRGSTVTSTVMKNPDKALGCSNKDIDMLRKHSQRISAGLMPQRASNVPGNTDVPRRMTDNRSSSLSGSTETWQRKRPAHTSDSDSADVQDHLSSVKRRRPNCETGRSREGSLLSQSHPLLVSASAKNLQQQERLYSREVSTDTENRPSTEETATLPHPTAHGNPVCTTNSDNVEPPQVSHGSSCVRSSHPLTFSPTKHAAQVLGDCIPSFPSPVAGPSTSRELDYKACFPAPPPSVLPKCDRDWRPHGGPRKRVAHQDTTTIQKCRSVVATTNKWPEPPPPRSDTQKKRKKSLRDDLLNSKR